MSSVSDYANYSGLRLYLRLHGDGSDDYVIALKNAGDLQLWKLTVDLEDVTGPSAFGLDDTHMRRDLLSERLYIASLASGETHYLRRASRTRIAGPAAHGKRVYVTFSVREDEEARFVQRVALEEIGCAR